MKPVYIIGCKVFLLIAALGLTISSSGQAVNDYRSASTGSWNTLSTWERYNGTSWLRPTAGEGTPNSADGTITIRNNHVVTVTANVTVDQVTINSGCTITINNGITLTTANGTGTDLTVSGTLRNIGTVTTTGTLSFNSGSTYIHDRNGGVIPSAAWNAASNCNITGIAGTAPSGLGQAFGNFTWDCIDQNTSFLFNGALTTINGNFTVGNTNANALVLASTNNSTYTLNVSGNFIFNDNAWLIIAYGDNITATVNVAGDFSMSGATASSTFFYYDYATGSSISLAKIILNVEGDFSQSGGTFDFATGSSNVSNFTELRLSGDFSLSGNAEMQTGTTDNSITNGAITFDKNGTQQYTVTTPSHLTYANFIIANTSTLKLNSSIILSSSSTAVWGGTFLINNGGTLDAGTNTIESSTGILPGANNTFTLSSGGTLITAHSNGVQSILGGTISLLLAAEAFSSGANYVFKGPVSGTFTTSPTAATFNNLTINRSLGVSMSQPVSISGVFSLVSGVLTTSLINILTINDNAVSTAGSASSYVNGPMIKKGNDPFTFPVGKSGVYGPVSISAPVNTTDAFRAEYIRSSGTLLGSITASGLVRVSGCEYWSLSRVTGTSNVNITLRWSGQSPCNAAVYVDNLATLTVAHFNGINWDSHSNNGGVAGTVIAGSVTRNSVSSFTIFSIGSTSNTSNPLPVKFGTIKGFIKGAGVQIDWKVYSEENVSHYEIERSADGNNFSTIGSINALNRNIETDYSFFDVAPLPGTGFYRIKSIDKEGKFIYSNVIKISTGNNFIADISIYPNPVNGEYISVQSANLQKGNYSFKIISMNGQQVNSQPFYHTGGSISQAIKLPSSVKPGIYSLLLESDGMKINSKAFIVQ